MSDEKEKVVSIEKVSKDKAPNTVEAPNKKITRQEFADVIQQLGQELSIIQEGLVDNVNGMYKNHVFPMQMELYALEQLCIEKGLFTKEEIDAKVEEHKQDILNRAQQIKENAEGKLEKVSEEEAEINERRAIVKANLNKEKEEKKEEKE